MESVGDEIVEFNFAGGYPLDQFIDMLLDWGLPEIKRNPFIENLA
jgi:hypothetical protein